jgi:hypothetical protein
VPLLAMLALSHHRRCHTSGKASQLATRKQIEPIVPGVHIRRFCCLVVSPHVPGGGGVDVEPDTAGELDRARPPVGPGRLPGQQAAISPGGASA